MLPCLKKEISRGVLVPILVQLFSYEVGLYRRNDFFALSFVSVMTYSLAC